MQHLMTLWIALGLGGGPKPTPDTPFRYELLRYVQVPAKTTETELKRLLGQPQRISQPAYECGGLSASEQRQAFYAFDYGPARFTGNARLGYVLDVVKFRPGAKPLHYGKAVWGFTTTQREIAQYFHVQPNPAEKLQPDGSRLLLIPGMADEGALFIFKNGHLSEFNYWTPC